MPEQVDCSAVCAVVVTYHPDSAGVRRQLATLCPQVAGVVVVDNGSSAETVTELALLVAEKRGELLANGENLGVAAAFNLGIARARERGASHVLLLDQDSMPAPDMVARLQAALGRLVARGEPVAAVGPVTLDPQTGHQSGFARLGPLRFQYVGATQGEETVAADFLISSGSLLPVSALQAIGGMDEGLFIDLVDTEWFLRAASAGLRAYGVTGALLHHGIGDRTTQLQVGGRKIGSLHQHQPLRHYYIFRNSIVLSRRAYVPWRWVMNNTLQLLGMFFYFSLFTPPRLNHLQMMLRGLWDGFRGQTGRFGR